MKRDNGILTTIRLARIFHPPPMSMIARSLVAQVSNLLYRRFPIGRPSESAMGLRASSGLETQDTVATRREKLALRVWRPCGCEISGLALLLSISCAFVSRSDGAQIAWIRTNDTLTCKMSDQALWTFSYATNQGKPYFHPLAVLGGEPLTTFKPKDHLWHYGLWFSWKYINGLNYWEEDKTTGKAQGATRWSKPEIKTNPDGSALINLKLDYVSPANGTMMSELRRLTLSAPDKEGNVLIDWVSTFQAGAEPLLLDRTHMPGEEGGAVNGGYAGLSLRAAQAPAKVEFLTMDKPIEKFESDRARPNSPAAACNVTRGERKDGVAILSLMENTHRPAPWYMINSQAMRWFSPALLAPAPKHVAPREIFTWKFRIITKAGGWTTADLTKAAKNFDPQVAAVLEQMKQKETEK